MKKRAAGGGFRFGWGAVFWQSQKGRGFALHKLVQGCCTALPQVVKAALFAPITSVKVSLSIYKKVYNKISSTPAGT